ncbi:autotransporter outer membrane beta-barrel domain-containing protein [Microbulbifer agarilyticus]|uniref:autotransporter domain-containing protein n=1 Tax=Microbulbifer agarilyticus TaxID=260552 RepID=UPI0018DCB0F0|nr:autotransporter outer membrane beta-barrel domain-containing protein [Microbulbifer agarilyticus]
MLPSVSRALGRESLGTFHEREGEQAWSKRNNGLSGVWVRAFGNSMQQSFGGLVNPDFDGTLWGLQVGLPLYGQTHANGQKDIFGIMLGTGGAHGDTRGFALGEENVATGKIDLDQYNIGGYWTHHWAGGAYVDSVIMYAGFDGEGRSNLNINTDIDGDELLASVEAGVPIPLDGTWYLEPQAQIIWQHQRTRNTRDIFSSITYDDVDAFTARVGGRFIADIKRNNSTWRPYFKLNVWYEDNGSDAVWFNTTPIFVERGQTVLETGIGLTSDFSGTTSLFGIIDYTTDIDSGEVDAFEARIGFHKKW